MKFKFSSEWFYKLLMHAAPELQPLGIPTNVSARNQRRLDAKSKAKKQN